MRHPIGLEDMTFRAVRTLREADLIAAEDTRNSIKLLNHFDIKTPMTSYHEYNRIEKARYLVEQMQKGKNVALITDAGTPGISDPGEDLVRLAHEAGIEVTSLPGACACVTALTLSGLPTRRFCFEAFLPQDKKERQTILEELKTETRTVILYEAPHRLVRTLEELLENLGDRRITLCRELTKKHETVFLIHPLRRPGVLPQSGAKGRVRYRHGRQKPGGDAGGGAALLGRDGHPGTHGSVPVPGDGPEGRHEGGGKGQKDREAGRVPDGAGGERILKSQAILC